MADLLPWRKHPDSHSGAPKCWIGSYQNNLYIHAAVRKRVEAQNLAFWGCPMFAPTVLCVENADSRFVISKAIAEAGLFRLVTVLHPDEAVSAFSALHADATVFDCRTRNAKCLAAAAKIRETNDSVPQFLVADTESMTIEGDRAGLIYAVADVDELSRHLRSLLLEIASRTGAQQTGLDESRTLRLERRESADGDARQVSNVSDLARQFTGQALPDGFTRITLSVCGTCRTVVAFSDSLLELQSRERNHDCPAQRKCA